MPFLEISGWDSSCWSVVFANDQVMYVLRWSFGWVVVSIEIMYKFRREGVMMEVA